MSIAPLALEDITDPELNELIKRAAALGVPDTLFPRILARSPEHAKVLMRALLLSHAGGAVDHRLKEVIRVLLARIAADPYFGGLRSEQARADGLTEARIEAGCAGPDGAAQFTAAERWALTYASEMYRNPERVDAAFYAEGKRYYTEAQIMELGAFIAFHYGMQCFMRAFGAAAPVRREP